MNITADKFYATFSATFNRWKVIIIHRKYKSIKMEELEFRVTYLTIEGYRTDRRLGASIQKIEGEDVTLELVKNRVILKKWKSLKKENLWGLFDPDMPRNLAKTVTVK